MAARARTTAARARRLVALGLGAGLASGVGATLAADDYDFGRAGFGAWTVPVPLDVQAAQDLVPGQGVLVVFVRPGGTASSMGVQPGDVLTSLDNTPVANRHDIREVLGSVQPGDAASVAVIQPDGTQATLTGTFQARPNRWPGAGGFGQGPGAGGPPPGVDPQAELMEQRHELLAEQIAMNTIQGLLDELHARLAAEPWPTGAWQVQFTLAHPRAQAAVHVTSAMTAGAAATGDATTASPSAAARPRDEGHSWAMHGALDLASHP